MRRTRRPEEKTVIPMAPLIDCVFLLLIYFMVGTTLHRQEADLSFQLPGTAPFDQPLDLPDEQVIEIRADGQVVVNDFPCDAPGAPRLRELAALLARYRQACAAGRAEPRVILEPAPQASQAVVVRVLDACGEAGIRQTQFALDEDSALGP